MASDTHFADEGLPEGSVVDGRGLVRTFDDVADFVIVGSGAAGATAAHRLSTLGYSVLICEEGPWVKTREFRRDITGTFDHLMREKGMQLLRGRAFMPMLQGRCVGGSTVVNSAIAWRMPEDIIDSWKTEYGLGDAITMRDLESHYDVLERDLNVHPVLDEAYGENNRMFVAQARAAGFTAQRMSRYEKGCKGSGLCMQGCPTGAKQGMNVSYIPWTLATGRARIVTSCKVKHVTVRGDRAVGVEAKSEGGASVFLRARHGVIMAASTVQSPNILRRTGLRSPALGKNFQMHPGHGLAAVYDKPVDMRFGATQGAESIHFRSSDGFKLETISMPPEIVSARVPGVGADFVDRLSNYRNLGVWVVQFRATAKGTVGTSILGKDLVTFTPNDRDMHAVRKAVVIIAKLMFDAGAKEVWPGIYGIPPVLTSMDEVRLLQDAPLEPRAYGFVASHLFGAARMGPDVRTSVVSPTFESHEVSNLYVVDSSVFPTNLGVNPQHGIMAMSRLAMTRIAENIARHHAA